MGASSETFLMASRTLALFVLIAALQLPSIRAQTPQHILTKQSVDENVADSSVGVKNPVSGAQAEMTEFSNYYGRLWIFTDAAEIQSDLYPAPPLCLDVMGRKFVAGTPAIVWPCHGDYGPFPFSLLHPIRLRECTHAGGAAT